MKHLQQKKRTGRHTSLIDAAEDVVKLLLKREDVSKITYGRISTKQNSTNKRVVKAIERSGGLCVTVSGSKTVQKLQVYTSDVKKLRRFIDEEFS